LVKSVKNQMNDSSENLSHTIGDCDNNSLIGDYCIRNIVKKEWRDVREWDSELHLGAYS
jgi:hypothetical protein